VNRDKEAKMMEMVKRFFKEDDGMGTVEIVIIVAVLVGLALVFRNQIYHLVDQLFGKIFDGVSETTKPPVSTNRDLK
jgi:Flp pilus assembly pilin Flp